MTFQIPFTFSNVEVLKRRSEDFINFTRKKETNLDKYLLDIGAPINRRQYQAICFRNFFINLFFISLFSTSFLLILKSNSFYLYGIITGFLISGFILFNQLNYPRILSNNKAKDIEKNLISAMQDMMVQLNSGVPIFEILVNLSESNYGQVSSEFEKITKEINSGVSQIEAIEKYGKINSSKYFQRVLWQLSNSLRAGSDVSIVISEGIRVLSDEQAIQIQTYGSKLNPLIMFYMLIAVILPSLGITFLIIVSSILNIQERIIQVIFLSIFSFVIFIQIMFLGIIKSKRPSLL